MEKEGEEGIQNSNCRPNNFPAESLYVHFITTGISIHKPYWKVWETRKYHTFVQVELFYLVVATIITTTILSIVSWR